MYHNLVTPLPVSLEQQWSDEVRYLHSLWHQGPPHSHSNPNPKPQPLNPTPINPNLLAPSNTTSFKKKKKKKNKITHPSDSDPVLDPSLVSTKDWVWQPAPVLEAETGWPEPVSDHPKLASSVEDKAKFAALQLQRSYFKACQDFFSRNREDSDDSDDDDDDVDSMDEDEEEDDSEEFDFFFGIFEEDQELRNYYKRKYEGGEFCCLVCGGTRQKVGKTFKDCVALVHHSTAISKTKRKSAHRAFGQVVCRVLGWDFKRLPNIVLSLEDPLGGPLENNENLNVDGANTEADHVGIGLNVDGANTEADHVGIGLNETNNKVVVKIEQVDGAAEVLVHETGEGPFNFEIDYSADPNEESADELYEDI